MEKKIQAATARQTPMMANLDMVVVLVVDLM
jgi:hypothetical protein